VIYELMGLSGQEYVDIYAASLKERGSDPNGSDPSGSEPDGGKAPGTTPNGATPNGEAIRIPETAAG